MTLRYLALSRNAWGAGDTPAIAKKKMRRAGGSHGTRSFIVFELDPVPDEITTNDIYGPELPRGTKKTVVEDKRLKRDIPKEVKQ